MSFFSDSFNLTSHTFWLVATWLFIIPLLLIVPQACRGRITSARDRRRLRLLATTRPGVIGKRRKAVIIIINGKSGGQLGALVRAAVKGCVPDHQIYDLSEVSPEEILRPWQKAEGELRILVCGGDGTVGWIMNTVETVMPATKQCPIAVLPMGTGNDLSRAYSWGSGVPGSRLTRQLVDEYVLQASLAPVQLLDRWQVSIYDAAGQLTKRANLNNYISIGIDAEIGLKFHEERIRHPERFSSQSKNIIKYALYGFEGAFEGYPIGKAFSITDPATSESLNLNPHWKGIVINNIPCYHGGANFWGHHTDPVEPDSGFNRPLVPVSTSDGLLEVMALSGTLHIGLVHMAVDTALRLAQLPGVCINVDESICIQIDGEPLRIPRGRIEVTRAAQYPVLKRPLATADSEDDPSDLSS